MFTDLCVDVVQLIGLYTDSTTDYLNIALTCKHFSGILKQTKEHPRQAKAIRHFTKMIIDKFGSKEWKLNGRLHRDNDKPAIIWADGSKEWCKNGKRHRDNDKPAIIWTDGSKEWCKNGLCHRDNDKPAIIWTHGLKEWWKNGKRIK